MQFLKTAFWVILAVAIALFCKANNRPMEVKIWGDIVWETRIWFPILLAFVAGVLPFWLVGRATKWRLKRKLDSMEKALVAATAVNMPPPSPSLPTLDPGIEPASDTLFPNSPAEKP
jgi:putative membrane protein